MLAPGERLQPALLDRLLDEQPDQRAIEPLSAGLLDGPRLKAIVLRDLQGLFNATALPAAALGPEGSPARRSVLAYGVPAMAGRCVSSVDAQGLAEALRRAIVEHEPRLLADSVVVEAEEWEQVRGQHRNHLAFRINARLWAQPVPLELLLRSDMDLESGQVSVVERGGIR